jgi:POT family proton-dependent oligopeptide transporter
LFTLFFAEMWERFSYYGMRALLTFYMIKGFLGYNDKKAYAVYGAYTALVYMTPYFGGMLADRILGARRAVVLGGLLMAAGHLLMTIENSVAFFGALGLLIAGNGFFKPNISTMVGGMYPQGSEKKDAGFTIFYMGINLGAAMSPIVCGYVGETYGWHYGFGLATIGMLIGVAIFVLPTLVTRLLIISAAIATGVAMLWLQDTMLQLAVRIFLGLALIIAGGISFRALGKAGLSPELGGAPDPERLRQKVGGLLSMEWAIYLGAILSSILFAAFVMQSELAGYALYATGIIALGYIIKEMRIATKIERERIQVILVLIFFSMLFWAFFEQSGSSLNNFTDRNVDRVFEEKIVAQEDIGTTITFRLQPAADDEELSKLPLLTQEQLGYVNSHPEAKARIEAAASWQIENSTRYMADDEKEKKLSQIPEFVKELKAQAVFGMSALSALRDHASREGATPEDKVLAWNVSESNVGMGYGGAEIAASEFQAANPIYILLFGLVFSSLWSFLGARGKDPSAPVKFGLGLLQLGMAFGVFWYGAHIADDRGMGGLSWLLIGYLLMTTGELCLSPVGLSLVTKLSPQRIVSTMMGAWFLATAFSNLVAAIIATLTSAGGHGGDDKLQVIPPPTETVATYGEVFGALGVVAVGAAIIAFLISPLLTKWMHDEALEH